MMDGKKKSKYERERKCRKFEIKQIMCTLGELAEYKSYINAVICYSILLCVSAYGKYYKL